MESRINNNNNEIRILTDKLNDSKRRGFTNNFEILNQEHIKKQIVKLTESSSNDQQEIKKMKKKLELVTNECDIRCGIISGIIENLNKIIKKGKGMTAYNENDWKENEHKKK